MTRAPQVMLLPVLLDLFLWLGPRLSAYPLIKSLLDLMNSLPAAMDEPVRAQWTQMQAFFEVAGQQFNLFAWLSPTLIGLPSLMAGALDIKQPLASAAPVWQINNTLIYLGLFGLFSLLGLGLSAMYWSQLARVVWQAARPAASIPPQAMSGQAHAGQIWWGLIQFVLLLTVLGIMVGAPVLMAVGVAALFSPALGQMIAMLGFATLMWGMFYLAFAVHGIALRGDSLLGAVRASLILMHNQFPSTAGLLFLGIIIYLGLGMVWSLPPGDSWLTGGAILGNAFIASGVLCATSFFYLDRAPTVSPPPTGSENGEPSTQV